MKLINCHIENFGKLSDLDIDFSGTSNVINQENGWGKSTLVTFIKVMFFGFSNETAKKIIDNDRKKFRPWQGGTYGGRITFEANGKRYEMYRVFGTKKSEDTFSLKDDNTNLDSTDFSENIGEELFKIDGESFLRTACISQNDCITRVTDSVNSKIGNLTDNTDDINNYEKVAKLLDNMKNKLSEKRKTGEIHKLKEQIHTISLGIESGKEIETAIIKNNELLENEKNNRENYKNELILIQNKIEQASRNSEMLAKLENYDKLCESLADKKKEANDLSVEFKNEIPNEFDLTDMIRRAEELTVLKTKMDNAILSDVEKNNLYNLNRIFENEIPSESDILECKEKADKLSKLKLCIASENLSDEEIKEIEFLSDKYSKTESNDLSYEAFEANIRAWNTRNEIKSGLGLKKAAFDNFKIQNESILNSNENIGNSNSKAFFIGGIISVIISIVLFMVGDLNIIVPILCLVLGFIGVGIYFVNSGKAKELRIERERIFKEKSESLVKYEEEIIKDEKIISDTEDKVKSFIGGFGETYCESEVLNIIYSLKSRYERYKELLKKKQIYEMKGYESAYETINLDIQNILSKYFSEIRIKSEDYVKLLQELQMNLRDYILLKDKNTDYITSKAKYEKIEKDIKEYIIKLGATPDENLVKQLNDINIILKNYQRVTEEIKRIEKDKNIFEEKNDVENIRKSAQSDNSESIEELKQRQANINETTTQVLDNINHYQSVIDSLTKQLDELMEDTSLLAELKEEKDRLSKKLKVAEYIREYLQKAKENLTSKYMNPIMESFKKYYEILSNKESDNCKIDAKINIKVVEKGEQRDTEFLSTGSQDLIGICMRLALVDAMYEGEKPFLVFDDPFVNLDEEKILGGIELLKEISKEYQVIYMTCHNSRIL
ncbi:MAG: AAA family ATPase [Lachnospiraceae bacterium]|nr:AAA family ATPase [Lachnospiraceae bacterium]